MATLHIGGITHQCFVFERSIHKLETGTGKFVALQFWKSEADSLQFCKDRAQSFRQVSLEGFNLPRVLSIRLGSLALILNLIRKE